MTSGLGRKLLRLLCALLLVMLGFAHKPVQTFAAGSTPGAFYTLPDGSIADICYGDDEDGAKKHAYDQGCDACRLVASTLLPIVDIDMHAPRPELRSTVLAWDAAFQRLLMPPSASPRGPPSRSDLV
ncbi:hypothetical protein M2360_000033 [Rhizobium sp. SG_E_25_P2]|uniref:hypothetical protein n=1 Tax=Rhizobium sp. SG_E_25_P2 TaxID=2879942 RepID=UPI002473B316|nr:hypothetical protein [Rhizobium sp. SG_E_25_P2]MDH6264652.1 hypothetical protein [Rhizobium sp. SG_E_25_P2]